ncbi:hypothetical protein AaE_000449 [Aphanomyces astaci]|uniref:MATE efflux family protein n=1 Tax=Aphanomyces astaci TaxID=112090 RepID=A0A6A5AZD8_APHAT|nr:hypothetical protein AaE_000449 [Aphanomyces astaci]
MDNTVVHSPLSPLAHGPTTSPTVGFVRVPTPDSKGNTIDMESTAPVETPTTLWKEVKANFVLAFPLILSSGLMFIPFTTSTVLIGHMDLDVTSAYIAASSLSGLVMSLTGVSVVIGLLSALDTLCPQAVGAGKLHHLGMYFQSGLIVMSLACIPIFILNWNVEAILIALNQEHEIAALAGEFNKYAILGLPGFILYELMQKGLQAQGIVTQMVWISAIDNVLNIGLGYWLGYHTSFGFVGVALGRTICYNLLPVFAYMYMLWNPVHKLWWPENHSWMAQWQTAWKHIPEFLKLGVPGMIMTMVEQLAFDAASITVGWLPSAVLSLAVHNVLLTINVIVYSISIGVGTACCIRLGNALGANEPNRARVISNASLGATVGIVLVVAAVFVASHRYVPGLFLNDPDAIEAFQGVVAIFAGFIVVDGLNSTSQSILRGMGQLTIGAIVNAVAFYVVGLPLVGLFAFQFEWGLQGTWLGLSVGLTLGVGAYLVIIYRSDWQARADEAILRNEDEKDDIVE